MINHIPEIEDILEAAERIKPYAKRTSVLTCEGLNRLVNAELFFKCENFQKVGAFKFRGATNAVFSLPDELARKGVATHSSGNHAAALALAARNRGIRAYVVMPYNSPEVKKSAVAGYGAEIIYCEPTLEARETTLTGVVEKTGATFIHPYDNYSIIAGQATAAKELIEEIPNLNIIMAPVGGGGLLSGTALSTYYFTNGTIVIAAEPEGADDAYRSLKEGKIIPSVNPQTIADGLLTSLSEKTFGIISKYVDRIVTVSEDSIISAMRNIWERMKIIVEPSSAVVFGMLLEDKIDLSGKRIGMIISGGNVDLQKLPWL
ncbi:MAG: pyridoxal-phosphate dependent enzyme [candidate division Zixibacteria bacterium]|nr:pyridoxal-phosphate dependent enzyme [candidate division Zixibacteria bacterium]